MRVSIGDSHLWFSAEVDATAFEGAVVFSVTTLVILISLSLPSLPPLPLHRTVQYGVRCWGHSVVAAGELPLPSCQTAAESNSCTT